MGFALKVIVSNVSRILIGLGADEDLELGCSPAQIFSGSGTQNSLRTEELQGKRPWAEGFLFNFRLKSKVSAV